MHLANPRSAFFVTLDKNIYQLSLSIIRQNPEGFSSQNVNILVYCASAYEKYIREQREIEC